jgi:hypothetical protein
MWVSTAEDFIYWGIDEANEVWWHKLGKLTTRDSTDTAWDPVTPKPAGDVKIIQLDVGKDGGVFATDGNHMYKRMGIKAGDKDLKRGTSW